MSELNYKGTKIEIGVKLGDQKYNFTYKKWSLYRGPLRRWHVALTHGSQRMRLTVNVQIGLSRPILQGFIKVGDQICELNYRGTKFEIGDKLGDQKYNSTLIIFVLKDYDIYLFFSSVMQNSPTSTIFLNENKIKTINTI